MTITLRPDLEAFARQEARAQGLHDVSEYVNQLLDEKQREAQVGRGRAIVERMTGTATSGLDTDTIMKMTRGED